ncbi:hypothetical protein VP01_7954g1, partial [Puccinia sorghi]
MRYENSAPRGIPKIEGDEHLQREEENLSRNILPTSAIKSSIQAPITQLFEVDYGHKSTASLSLTKAASKPLVLDSGATHHLIDNPDVFLPTANSNIKILTGGCKNFLHATAVGSTTLINQLGKRIKLDNALLVTSLNRSLISIPRVFKQEFSI